ncbi:MULTISPECIES: hypothetical protein [Burkholderia]|jgi:hypothetical protein|uniref:Uncharacterized protein n=2 Tax=Burkholderia contaminans TaxID=488447 RepID=A0A1E3G165_9BURK|nr:MULTISPECIES: hypothetical protein [Burkholderia]UTP25099.1 hypothetical protein NMB33_32420 [Burkholderia sp. FXe9]KKL32662.1 hypothetical protein WR31_34070 [Burkholderia contaminans LMG 23361]MBA9829596.1 hypothetical protein [Burkholderia contaminans]MBA9835639.1 hypothetical protein [Burkholderia contaminans]MBA9861186.1 hypothetical protein [Burkholderia contaminans]
MSHPLDSAGYRRLLDLQRRIHDYCEREGAEDGRDHSDPAEPLWPTDFNHVTVAPMRAGLHVRYFGGAWDEPFDWTLQCLAERDVADLVTDLAFSGLDEGANGSREWDFGPLLDSDGRFPMLRSLYVRPTEPADHNQSMIVRRGLIMQEGGEIARFAAKAPFLTELTVPNAPDAHFFDVPLAHLERLRIGGGDDTQQFIEHLAGSDNLSSLGWLDFSESTALHSTWKRERDAGSVTSFDAYERLLKSPAGQRLHRLTLRNTCLDREALDALQALHPRLSLMVIQAGTGGYVSHFKDNVFPSRHLIQRDPGDA